MENYLMHYEKEYGNIGINWGSIKTYSESGNNFLAHHGIKGQRWGKRNGPPYPLSNEKHNKVVLRNYKNKSGTAYDLSNLDESYGMIPMHFTGKKYRSDAFTLANLKNNSSMVNPNWFNPNAGKNLETGLLTRINPGRGTSGQIGHNNCVKCSAATTLMKMGYNQISAGQAFKGLNMERAVGEWFNNAKIDRCNSTKEAEDLLRRMPPGSFGTVSSSRYAGDNKTRIGGHAMSWTKMRNGDIRIEDGQVAKTFSSLSEACKEYGLSGEGLVSRLDKATPNWERLEQDGAISLRGNRTVRVDPRSSAFIGYNNDLMNWNGNWGTTMTKGQRAW